ncbi:MAG: saccharopine dehydrogenase NADP-binding domain-containing protein [Candidatus Melainabacteria bacterium]|nr:saccharopine dehydrogenase NADP-binding domain-containing protein [Candidatus Melainabacteria bacterium]
MSTKQVLIIGGTGYFGRILTQDLLQFTDYKIVAASRSPGKLQKMREELSTYSSRFFNKVIDLNNTVHCNEGINGSDVVICAAGPFQEIPITLANACMEKSIPYIDLADDREYVMRVRKLFEQLKPSSYVCTGWSSVPALSGAMSNFASKKLDKINSIQIQIAPGNKAPRGFSTVTSLINSIGKEFSVMQNGSWSKVKGWSQPRVFKFPAPVGNKTGYLVDVADHELFPLHFNADTVQFRAGAEFGFFNLAMSGLAALTNYGIVKSLRPFSSFLQTAMSTLGFLGHDWGALGVEVQGTFESKPKTIRLSVVADHQGQQIPVMPASIMCRRILNSSDSVTGLVPFDSWISREELEAECAMRNYRLFFEHE